LVAAYPSIVQKFSLGKSVENRDIWCIKNSFSYFQIQYFT